MLALRHRIVLEDDLGERHTLHLLDVIEDRFYVLLPPSQAERVAKLQEATTIVVDDAIEILTEHLAVISLRDHRFLNTREAAAVLARSRHHILKLCGLRLDDRPATEAPAGEMSPRAFADECIRRQRW